MANAKARKNFLSKVIINGDTLTSEEDIKSGVCRAYRTLLSEIEDWRPRIGDLGPVCLVFSRTVLCS